MLPRVGAPAVSPDGKLAVFSVTEPAYASDQQMSDLWLVATDGKSSPRRLTQTRASESGMTWSPDSKRIAFAAKRDGDEANQIYILDIVNGGEALARDDDQHRRSLAEVLTRRPQDRIHQRRAAGKPQRRRQQTHRRGRKARKYKIRAYDSFPIRNWDTWMPENRQPHAFVQTVGVNDARDLFAGTAMIKQPGFDGRSTPGASELDLVWTPDGEADLLCLSQRQSRRVRLHQHRAVASPDRAAANRNAITGSDDLKGGDGWSAPEFSPDGRTLYALREVRGKSVFSPTHLAAFDWPSLAASRRYHFAGERDPLNFVIAPNNRDIYLLAEDSGHSKIYRGKSSGGEAQLAFDMKTGGYGNLVGADRAGAPVLIANFDSAVSPAGSRAHRPATGHSSGADEIHRRQDRRSSIWRPLEHFWFDSKRGARIHNMIVRPPGFDPAKKYPLLVLMHGGPHSMWRDTFSLRWNYHLLAAPGYVVLLTNYTGSTGFGADFSRAIQGDPLEGPALEINQAADEAIARYSFIDGSRQCAGGASYGGHLANWMQASTTRYRCLISHAGLINLESQWATSDVTYSREQNMGGPPWQQGVDWNKQNPIRYASQWKTPVLVTVGERDFRVPLNNTLEYWSVLQRQQVESRLLIFPDENHWILQGENSRQFFNEVREWLARWLKAQ